MLPEVVSDPRTLSSLALPSCPAAFSAGSNCPSPFLVGRSILGCSCISGRSSWLLPGPPSPGRPLSVTVLGRRLALSSSLNSRLGPPVRLSAWVTICCPASLVCTSGSFLSDSKYSLGHLKGTLAWMIQGKLESFPTALLSPCCSPRVFATQKARGPHTPHPAVSVARLPPLSSCCLHSSELFSSSQPHCPFLILTTCTLPLDHYSLLHGLSTALLTCLPPSHFPCCSHSAPGLCLKPQTWGHQSPRESRACLGLQ